MMILIFSSIILLLIIASISIGLKYILRYFKYLPKIVQYLLFTIALIIGTVLYGLFFQEMIIPCHSKSWLMMLEEQVDKKMQEKNTPQTVIQHIIVVYKKDTIYRNIPEKEYIIQKYDEHMTQLDSLRKWTYLNNLPKNIPKEEYIAFLSNTPYPLWLAMIHFRESSFKPDNYNGKYIGLGQHSPQFVKECGYTIDEYKSSWKVQIYVSNEYIKKYVKRNIKSPQELYAYWLDCNWNGRNVIYHSKSRLANGKNPYYPNKGLDKNKNKKIEVDSDLFSIFARLNNKNNFTNLL